MKNKNSAYIVADFLMSKNDQRGEAIALALSDKYFEAIKLLREISGFNNKEVYVIKELGFKIKFKNRGVYLNNKLISGFVDGWGDGGGRSCGWGRGSGFGWGSGRGRGRGRGWGWGCGSGEGMGMGMGWGMGRGWGCVEGSGEGMGRGWGCVEGSGEGRGWDD